MLRLIEGRPCEAWTHTACEQIERLADRLLDGHREKLPGAAVELHNWLPKAGRQSTQELFDLALSRDDALETVSRAHGFVSWREAQSAGHKPGSPDFRTRHRGLARWRHPRFMVVLDRVPDLVARRSHYGHRATLLHYLAANGVKTYRQRVPQGVHNRCHSGGARCRCARYGEHVWRKSDDERTFAFQWASRAAGVTDDVLAVIDGAA